MSSFSATTLTLLLGASTAFAQYTTAPSATGDACANACVTAYRACQGGPDANQSLCASNLTSCVGYNPFDNSGSFVTPTACSTTASATPYSTAAPTYAGGADSCATDCVTKFRACQGDLSNTRAQCASDLSSCVGYVPFDNSGSFVTPTACSKTASATAYSTAASTSAGGADSCATDCVTKFRACQSDLSNTRAQCASDLSSCVGYVPFDNSGSFVTPTACSKTASASATSTAAPKPTGDCAANCVTAFRSCQSNLTNTRAQCASDLASCIGYNPFDNSGSFVTPTACSSTSAPPTGSKTTAAASYPSTAGSPSTCAATCVTSFRSCQSNLNNTRAQCAADLASCVGYNPFDNSGSFVTPTACAGGQGQGNKTANATMSAPAVYTGGAVLNIGGSFAALAAGAGAVALLV